jgi:ribosomal-protein-alanine N-acetyltransferase
LDKALDSMLRDKEYIFIIANKATNKCMGTFVFKMDTANHKAEIGYWLGKPYWGKNFTTEAVKAMLPFGFINLDLNRLEAHHLLFNNASGRVLEKCGFYLEGQLRSEVEHDGPYHDIALYGLLKKHFLSAGLIT